MEQRVNVNFCVELQKLPSEILEMLNTGTKDTICYKVNWHLFINTVVYPLVFHIYLYSACTATMIIEYLIFKACRMMYSEMLTVVCLSPGLSR
jgi:hypothetical protein